MRKTTNALIIGLMFIAITGLLVERRTTRQQAYNLGYGDALLVLPCVADIQRRVGAKPDGIVGKETLAKWDKAICQQSANKYINDKSMGIEK